MKDKTFTFRINNDLLDSLSRHCERHEISKSVFIVKAIKKALESEGIESPKSPAPSVIDESINVNNSLNIDELKEALEGDLKPSIESIARELLENYLKANKALNSAFDEQSIEKLELQIDELKEAQNAINDKIYQRLENLENQSSQEVKPLIDENKQNDTPPPVISKFYPNQKIFKPYHVEQFKVVYDLLTGFKINFLSTKNSDAIQQWIISDQEGNKAGLFLNGASHWSLEKVNFGDGDLKGFFEDCNFNDNYLDDLLIANNIDLDEIAEGADQSASATIDSPDFLGLSLGIISYLDFSSKTGITMQTLNNWFREDRAIPQKYQDYIEIHNKENKELLIKKLPIPIKQK